MRNGGTLGTSISWFRIMTMTLTSSSVLSLSCVSSSAGCKHSAVSRPCSVEGVGVALVLSAGPTASL
uniref:Secreted protein n=2 Tax=Phytophthora fragariae TaxID=53985 RepID=A0A6A3D8H5_9STRA|nr:hypothetical protein PF009_g33194 [Phytophthora fragariae]